MQNATLSCNNFLRCARYHLTRRKPAVNYFDPAPWNMTGIPDTTSRLPSMPYHPPKSQGTGPGNVACSLETHSPMSSRLVCCGKTDQCTMRNCEHHGCVPGCAEMSGVPNSCERVLRVEEDREIEASKIRLVQIVKRKIGGEKSQATR